MEDALGEGGDVNTMAQLSNARAEGGGYLGDAWNGLSDNRDVLVMPGAALGWNCLRKELGRALGDARATLLVGAGHWCRQASAGIGASARR
ncbi:unnamed protein product [Ilex paraguariensis]|uniref:Uncharacterized protein n=1 Tax=Ilex paraguariensis TaxID=185542 RepID=A0ABC8QRE7_9AQUA